MVKEPRLSWGGSQRAQAEADAAFLAARKSPAAKPKRQHRNRGSRGQFVGTYRDYLKSPQWRRKRRKALRHYGRRCTVCGATERLQVHHRHYRTLFRESMADLDLLCDGCHSNHHESDGKACDPMTREFLSLDL